MILTISDIMYINDTTRNLKQKNIMWIRDKLVGLDNFNYIILMNLDASKLSVFPNRGLILNQRDLSKFVKSISTESSFEIDENAPVSTIVSISEVFIIKTSQQMENMVLNSIRSAMNIDAEINNISELDMTNTLQEVYSMTKNSGAIQYKYDKFHILTLFSGVLPLAKSDKLFIKIWDNSESTFLVRFRIQKKQLNIFVYLLYLKI